MRALLLVLLSSCIVVQVRSQYKTTAEIDKDFRDVVIATRNATELEGMWHGVAKRVGHAGWKAQELEFSVMSYCFSVPDAMNRDASQMYYVYSYYNKTASSCYHSHSFMVGDPLKGTHEYFTTGTRWTEHIVYWGDSIGAGGYSCRLNYICGDRNGADRFQTGSMPCPLDHVFYEMECMKPPSENETEESPKAIISGLTEDDINNVFLAGVQGLQTDLIYIDADRWLSNLDKDCSPKNQKIMEDSGYCMKYPNHIDQTIVLNFPGPSEENCRNYYCMLMPPVPDMYHNFSSFSYASWVFIYPDDDEGTIFDVSEPMQSNVFRMNFFIKDGKHRLGVILAEDKSYEAPEFMTDIWTHVAVTWTSRTGRLKIYVDGKLQYQDLNFHARQIQMVRAIIHIGIDFGKSDPDREECLSGSVAGVTATVSDQPDEAVWSDDTIKQHRDGLDLCNQGGVNPPLIGCMDSPHAVICSPLVERDFLAHRISTHLDICDVGGVNDPITEDKLTGLVSGKLLSALAGTWYTVAMTEHGHLNLLKYLVGRSCLGYKANTLLTFYASYNEQSKECMVNPPVIGTMTGHGLDMTTTYESGGMQRVTHILNLDEDKNCFVNYVCNRDPSEQAKVCNSNITYLTLQCKTPSIVNDIEAYINELHLIDKNKLCYNPSDVSFTDGETWAQAGDKSCAEAVEEAARNSGKCRPADQDDEDEDRNPITGGIGKASAESKAAAEGPGAAAQAGASAMSGRKRRSPKLPSASTGNAANVPSPSGNDADIPDSNAANGLGENGAEGNPDDSANGNTNGAGEAAPTLPINPPNNRKRRTNKASRPQTPPGDPDEWSNGAANNPEMAANGAANGVVESPNGKVGPQIPLYGNGAVNGPAKSSNKAGRPQIPPSANGKAKSAPEFQMLPTVNRKKRMYIPPAASRPQIPQSNLEELSNGAVDNPETSANGAANGLGESSNDAANPQIPPAQIPTVNRKKRMPNPLSPPQFPDADASSNGAVDNPETSANGVGESSNGGASPQIPQSAKGAGNPASRFQKHPNANKKRRAPNPQPDISPASDDAEGSQSPETLPQNGASNSGLPENLHSAYLHNVIEAAKHVNRVKRRPLFNPKQPDIHRRLQQPMGANRDIPSIREEIEQRERLHQKDHRNHGPKAGPSGKFMNDAPKMKKWNPKRFGKSHRPIPGDAVGAMQ